jgi:hypothetical protein
MFAWCFSHHDIRLELIHANAATFLVFFVLRRFEFDLFKYTVYFLEAISLL